MKKKIILCLTLFSILLLVLSGCGKNGGSKETVVKVGTPGNVKGLYYVNNQGKLTGFEIDVLKAIDKELKNYKFKYEQIDFSGLFTALRANKVNVVSANLRRNTEREKDFSSTKKSYMYAPYKIVTTQNEVGIKTLKDLDGKKVGVVESSPQVTILKKYMAKTGEKINLVYISAADIPNFLEQKKIDATILPEFYSKIYNDSFKNKSIKFKSVGNDINIPGKYGKDANAYFFLSKKDTKLNDAMSQAITKIRKNGELSKISKKYFGKDYTKKINVSEEKNK